jgi:hypothetical protein
MKRRVIASRFGFATRLGTNVSTASPRGSPKPTPDSALSAGNLAC